MRDFKPTLTRAVSLLELSKLARKVDAEVLGPGNTLIALAKLTQRYLGYPLRKEMNVRAGNWAGDLDQTQRDCESSCAPLDGADIRCRQRCLRLSTYI
jgi:hypothetical protein